MFSKKTVCRLITVTILFCAGLSFWAGADTILFKDGRLIEGEIIDRGSRSVEFEYYGTSMTYDTEDIERINDVAVSGTSPSPAPAKESYRRDSFPTSEPVSQDWGRKTSEPSPSGDKIDLALNLPEGSRYNIRYTTSQKIVQDVGGQIQEIRQDTEFRYVYTVQKVDASGNMDIEIRYHSIRFDQYGPFGHVGYDSENPPEEVHPVALGYDVMVGEAFRITVSDSGEILRVKGMDDILNKLFDRMAVPEGVDKEAVRRNLYKQFGDQALKDSIGNFFAVYPGYSVVPGDSWDKTVDVAIGFPLRVMTTYTLNDVSSGEARVMSSSQIHSRDDADPVNMGGMSLRYEVSGTQEGSILLDAATGWTIRGQISQEIGGKVLVISGDQIPPGTTWPISIESTVSFEPF